jgi:hypothetical protein
MACNLNPYKMYRVSGSHSFSTRLVRHCPVEATRRVWRIGPRRDKVCYSLAVHEGWARGIRDQPQAARVDDVLSDQEVRQRRHFRQVGNSLAASLLKPFGRPYMESPCIVLFARAHRGSSTFRFEPSCGRMIDREVSNESLLKKGKARSENRESRGSCLALFSSCPLPAIGSR